MVQIANKMGLYKKGTILTVCFDKTKQAKLLTSTVNIKAYS
jgi:hypothetical protein